MTLEANWDLKNSTELRNRVASAIAKAADDVRNEAAATPHHTERIAWAIAVLSSAEGPQNEAHRAMWLVVQNATIQASGEGSTDGDIEFVVNGLVNFLAGVDTAE